MWKYNTFRRKHRRESMFRLLDLTQSMIYKRKNFDKLNVIKMKTFWHVKDAVKIKMYYGVQNIFAYRTFVQNILRPLQCNCKNQPTQPQNMQKIWYDYFTKEKLQRVYKHTKRCLAPLTVRSVQLKSRWL